MISTAFVSLFVLLTRALDIDDGDRIDAIDYEPVGEWVLTVPFDDDASKALLFDNEEEITVKRKDRIGDTIVYVLRGKDSKVSSALASKAVEYDSYTKNYMVVAGPGDAKARPVAAGKTPSSRNKTRGKRDFKFELQRHVGNVVELSTDYECRTEPPSSNVGYENGHFSWGLDRIDQRSPILDRQACFFSTSLSIVPDDQIVDVYVVDTGVQNDPSFVLPVSYDYSYYDVDNVHSSDCNGHATHVAGLVASTTYGVSPWNVQIHSIKALDCQGKGDFASLTAAFLWIDKHKSSTRRSIINLSLGSNGGQSSFVSNLLQRMWTKDGVFTIVAAGNYGESSCDVFPANVPDVIAVGATDARDDRASFSNYGSCTDVFAPGVSIVSCDFQDSSGGLTLSGTSMSAPIVSGALANWMYAYDASQPSSVVKTSFLKRFTKNHIDPSTISQGTSNAIVYVGSAPDNGNNRGNFDGVFVDSGSVVGRSISMHVTLCFFIVIGVELF